jgi:hypothetical protein
MLGEYKIAFLKFVIGNVKQAGTESSFLFAK